jgi:hypothetical protein
VDEIKLFEVLRPPPPSGAERMREAARARLTTAMNGLPDPMHTPVGGIIRQSRAVRARHRIPSLAAALAVAAGAAVAVGVLAAPGHQATGQPRAQLAAWTVTKQADGYVRVTIRELLNPDPAGLQATLRANGVPAVVHIGWYGGPPPPGCQPYPADPSLRKRIVPMPPQGRKPGAVLTIDPAAIPPGVGVDIVITPPIRGDGFAGIGAGVSLVAASRQCTGS